MSLRNPTQNEIGPEPVPALRKLASASRNVTVTGVHATAFWGAIALPVPVLGLLYGGVSDGQMQLMVALLVLNALCLVVGHDYKG